MTVDEARDIIDTIEALRPEKKYHYICNAGTPVKMIDEWGRQPVTFCRRKESNDDLDMCLICDGKIHGYISLPDYDRGYDYALTAVLANIHKFMPGYQDK